MIVGIDVSHHQKAAAIDWQKLAAQVSFCIARATYGTRLDTEFAHHIKAARAVGMKVGAYHFFRQNQAPEEQLRVFRNQLGVGEISSEDILPALDIEDNTKHDGAPNPGLLEGARFMSDELCKASGDCMIYGSQRDWSLFGKAAWWLERPLWVAHYTTRPEPATPGDRPWTIWQNSGSARFDGFGADLDRNICEAIPLIGYSPDVPDL